MGARTRLAGFPDRKRLTAADAMCRRGETVARTFAHVRNREGMWRVTSWPRKLS